MLRQRELSQNGYESHNIFTSTLELEDMNMVESLETEYYVPYPGLLCSAISLGTCTQRSLTIGQVLAMDVFCFTQLQGPLGAPVCKLGYCIWESET